MIKVNFDKTHGILTLTPTGKLTEADFDSISERIDSYIQEKGDLTGLMLHIGKFPFWENLSGFLAHANFVHTHFSHIKKIAVITDLAFADIAEKMASVFKLADIQHFAHGENDKAKAWILANA